MRGMGPQGLLCIGIFYVCTCIRSGIRLEERSAQMGLDHIKSMKREDFKDNEYIDQLVEELNATGANVVVGKFDELINWGRANSLWPLCFGTSCCAIEFMCLGAARYDMARFRIRGGPQLAPARRIM